MTTQTSIPRAEIDERELDDKLQDLAELYPSVSYDPARQRVTIWDGIDGLGHGVRPLRVIEVAR